MQASNRWLQVEGGVGGVAAGALAIGYMYDRQQPVGRELPAQDANAREMGITPRGYYCTREVGSSKSGSVRAQSRLPQETASVVLHEREEAIKSGRCGARGAISAQI